MFTKKRFVITIPHKESDSVVRCLVRRWDRLRLLDFTVELIDADWNSIEFYADTTLDRLRIILPPNTKIKES